MNLPKIRRLIVKAQAGDKKALATLVTWGTDTAVGLILASNDPIPDWARWHLLQEHQRRRCAKKGRAAGAAVRNAEQGRAFRAKVAKAAALVSLHDMPEHKRVDAVRDVFLRLGPSHFGLAATPDDKTIRAVIKEIIGD